MLYFISLFNLTTLWDIIIISIVKLWNWGTESLNMLLTTTAIDGRMMLILLL